MDIYNNQDFLELFYTKRDFSVDFFAETFDLDDAEATESLTKLMQRGEVVQTAPDRWKFL